MDVTREVGCALAALVLNRAMVNSPEFFVFGGRRDKWRVPEVGNRRRYFQMLYRLSYGDAKPPTGLEPATVRSKK
ncbi:hypothetical protein GCM10023083_70060 [Streptomyces phyllanthi]